MNFRLALTPAILAEQIKKKHHGYTFNIAMKVRGMELCQQATQLRFIGHLRAARARLLDAGAVVRSSAQQETKSTTAISTLISGLRAVRVECSQGFGKLAGVDFGSDLTGLGLAR